MQYKSRDSGGIKKQAFANFRLYRYSIWYSVSWGPIPIPSHKEITEGDGDINQSLWETPTCINKTYMTGMYEIKRIIWNHIIMHIDDLICPSTP